MINNVLQNILSANRVLIDKKLYWLNGVKAPLDFKDPHFFEAREFLRKFVGLQIKFDVVYEKEKNIYIDLYLPKSGEFELVNAYLVRQGFCSAIGKGYENEENLAKIEKLGIHGGFSGISPKEEIPPGNNFNGMIERVLPKSVLIRAIIDNKHFLFQAMWSGANLNDKARDFLEFFLILKTVSISVDSREPARVTINHSKGNVNLILIEKGLATPDFRTPLKWLPIDKKDAKRGLKLTKILHAQAFEISGELFYLNGIRIPKEIDQIDAQDLLRPFINQSCSYTEEKVLTINDQVRSYGVLYIESRKIFPAKLLVEKGLATVFRPKKDEQPTSIYSDLLELESKAIKDKVGIHNPNYKPQPYIDANENSSKAKSFLGQLQRSGKIQAVVVFQISPTKLKLRLPKERLVVIASLAGIRTPYSKVGNEYNAISQAAGKFVSNALTKDITIEIEDIDKSNAFTVNLWVQTNLLSQQLVELGYATVTSECKYYNTIKAAENIASAKGIGLWALEKKIEDHTPRLWKIQIEGIKCCVTEYNGEGEGFIQIVNDDIHKLGEITNILNNSTLNTASTLNGLVAARSEDGKFYRAKVIKKLNEKALVRFVDFGNVLFNNIDRKCSSF
eukprot:NODE_48_length_31852_cov_1.054168.p6 type:complete len:619 gc:universal NODE_48_length_31852_cov_1.054168:11800-13656(+)